MAVEAVVALEAVVEDMLEETLELKKPTVRVEHPTFG